jgi:hypothetical protein
LNRTGNYPDKENIDTNVLRVKETTTLKANVVSTPKRHVSLRRVAHCGACVPRGCSWMLRLLRAMHSCVDTRKILQRSCGCLLSVGAESPRGAGIRNTTCSSRSGGLAMKTGPLRSRLFIRSRRISDDCFGFAEVHLQAQRASVIRLRCIVSYRRNCLSRYSGIHPRR